MDTKVTHTLTVTETTSTMPAENKLACNIRVLLTKNGLPLFLETLIGAICLVLVFQPQHESYPDDVNYAGYIFILCVISTILSTFLLLLCCVISPMAAEILPKTGFYFLHSLAAFLFYAPSSLACLITIGRAHQDTPFETGIAMSVLGVMNAVLFLISTVFSYESFKSS